MRMIDADRLCEDLLNRWNIADTRKEELIRQVMADVVTPIVVSQPTVNRWVSCSERLPCDGIPVNITWVNRKPVSYYVDIKDKHFTATGIYYRGKWFWYSCVCEDLLYEYGNSKADAVDEDVEIIAWMPLPEPYKEEEENAKLD